MKILAPCDPEESDRMLKLCVLTNKKRTNLSENRRKIRRDQTLLQKVQLKKWKGGQIRKLDQWSRLLCINVWTNN